MSWLVCCQCTLSLLRGEDTKVTLICGHLHSLSSWDLSSSHSAADALMCSSTGKCFMEVTQPSTNTLVPTLMEERQPPNDSFGGQAIAFRPVCYCCVCSAPPWHWFPGDLQQPHVLSRPYTRAAEHRWDSFTPGIRTQRRLGDSEDLSPT